MLFTMGIKCLRKIFFSILMWRKKVLFTIKYLCANNRVQKDNNIFLLYNWWLFIEHSTTQGWDNSLMLMLRHIYELPYLLAQLRKKLDSEKFRILEFHMKSYASIVNLLFNQMLQKLTIIAFKVNLPKKNEGFAQRNS